MSFSHLDSEVISDVCANENLPEVELVSLLEDELPQYKLRVDSLFLYDHQDWIQSPSQKNHAISSLSPVLAEETFRYMILGSDRVEQMTKTYNDIDMVTHLLAERDRDLELAARIGQALLKRNHSLAEQNESLEEQLAHALDQVNQLQHELSKKDDLLRIVSIASEESETDSSCSTPLRSNDSFNVSQGLLQLDNMQSKLRDLEDENFLLRSQACHLKTETITYEEKEQQLVMDCVNEIRESNAEIVHLSEELSEKNDELIRYHEEISTLLAQIVDLQHKLKEYAIEKEELKLHLQASKDAQRQLTTELHELQDLNAECLGMLHESQEEVKLLRSKSSPTGQLRRPQSCTVIPLDSLAAEIEGTMRKGLSLDEECFSPSQRDQHKRVFDTVRVANDATRCRSASYPPPLPIPGSNRSCVMTAKPFESGLQPSEKGHKIIHCNSMEQAITKNVEVQSKEAPKHGQPGVPWAQDIAMALHRLSLRRQNYLCERQFFVDEWERQQKVIEDEKEDCSGCSTPNGSILSMATYHSEFTDFSATSSCLRSLLPEKLQIVKPLEGSQTLHQWQQLAQPNLGTILDPRPGVVTKGFKPLPEDAVYHLCDVEEDEEDEKDEGITFQVKEHSLEDQRPPMPKTTASIFLPPSTTASVAMTAANPGKCLSSTNSTFTFTNCRILHPSDITQVTPSAMYSSSSFGTCISSTSSTGANSPAMSCRLSTGDYVTKSRESTATFSSTSNLTKLLQEQGISAKVCSSMPAEESLRLQPPRTLAIPSTPPNSPSHSPPQSPVPFEPRVNVSENFLASRPAETFLQEMYGLKPSRNPPDLGQLKMNLVERLKRLGIARVVKPPVPENDWRKQDSTVFLGTGSALMGGLRRNQSLPTLIGSLAAPVCTSSPKMDILKEDCGKAAGL
ncbi:trafficking kinesin-binding protein 2 isoform X2 [Pleurodeles waltl]|uniref:trafficking kinesin-binding protein 2 isoform X2 n=1 Tax=Pleurodeles waltl TaxID=8319 RepID=UPI0037098CE2